MREEIWTEKIFKDDAGYFLRITKLRTGLKNLFEDGSITKSRIESSTIPDNEFHLRNIYIRVFDFVSLVVYS